MTLLQRRVEKLQKVLATAQSLLSDIDTCESRIVGACMLIDECKKAPALAYGVHEIVYRNWQRENAVRAKKGGR